jgi:hypothetical protein
MSALWLFATEKAPTSGGERTGAILASPPRLKARRKDLGDEKVTMSGSSD